MKRSSWLWSLAAVPALTGVLCLAHAADLNDHRAAIEDARKAREAANQAVQAANAADAAAKEAYYTYMAEWRAERLAERDAPPAPPDVDVPVNNPIDAFIAAKWPEGSAPQLSDDATFIRRVYLDVLGMIPSPDEVHAFLKDSSETKRAALIDRVLARDRDYGIHWSQFWEDALASNGRHQGGVGTRANFRDFIIESFSENKPYDIFVTQLIDSTAYDYHGGFVKSANHLESTQTASNVGQVFLGTRMKCASCHDHFLNLEWSQKRFLGFASFFSSEDLDIIRCEVNLGEKVPTDFAFETTVDIEMNPVTKEEEELAARLATVSHMIVDPANPRFSASFVNRLWKRYLGLGLIEPVDDFRDDTPASHPQLLEWMAHEFASSGYDVKHMVRLILNSRTYQFQFDPDLADRYESGRSLARYYRSPSHRRLTAEQVLDSIQVALKVEAPRTAFVRTSTELSRSLGRPETRNEVQTTRAEDVAVLQALQLLNGPDLHSMIASAPLPASLAQQDDPVEAVEDAFVSILSRPPSPQEREVSLAFVGSGNDPQAWGDMVWALVVSPEFHYID